MKIAINLRTYVKGKIGGLENYVHNVVQGIAASQHRRRDALTIFTHKTEVDNVRQLSPDARIVPVVHDTALGVIEAELERGGYDLLFCPLLVLDPLKPKIPSAVMIPDLQHEFFPDFFDANTLQWRRQNYRPSTIYASRIFTLSEHSKQTIVDKFRVSPEKIEVIYLDVENEFKDRVKGQASETFLKLGLPPEYLFFPANFWPHKNHSNLLRALQTLILRHPHLGLALTGASSGQQQIRAQVQELGLEKNVVFAGYLDRTTLVEVYQHAKIVTFVSRFEGFGIPILEAYHTGVPVITGRAGSCEEIAGDAALHVDELDPDSIAEGVEQVLTDEPLRTAMIQAGYARARQFSWKRAVDLTLKSFDRITDASYVPPVRVEVQEYPTVSIVTPSYNMGRFIKETIDSVLIQDYPYIDYVVMDAGSADDTVPILKSYGNKFRWESKPDKGQADAVNKGFQASKGQIFTFLNADDTYLPGAVSTAVQYMISNPSMGVVYGEANHIQEDGAMISRYPTLPYDAQTLNRTCFICQPASFMWSDVFQTAGCMNPSLHFALDYDLWMRIAKLYPMLRIDAVLANSRMYRENKTLGKRREVYMEIMSAAKAHYGYIPYDWVFGYSCYLVDRKDQFFDQSHPSLMKIALTLLLGTYYNKGKAPRYWREWAMHVGLSGQYLGRYEDGWISRKYITEQRIGDRCEEIHITGRHYAPFTEGLNLTLRLDGKSLHREQVQNKGPFALRVHCPPEFRGRWGKLEIEANRTFRPVASGDYRKLSCIIDSLNFVGDKESS
ncbi:MAG TPA: glycosyltransferase [Bryobacteraceae bacterium]|nr:glycosyltransferase [Bryobacteraceae bacterium]